MCNRQWKALIHHAQLGTSNDLSQLQSVPGCEILKFAMRCHAAQQLIFLAGPYEHHLLMKFLNETCPWKIVVQISLSPVNDYGILRGKFLRNSQPRFCG